MSKYTTKDVQSEVSGINFMDVGIHENCELKRIEYRVSDKGSEFMAFYFEDEKGKTLAHTEYKPNDDDPDTLNNKITNQIKRVKHIATKFITNEQFDCAFDTFKEFAEKTIKALGTSFVGKKVRLKVIYSWNNYTSLPKYVPFIESMDVLKEKSVLEISSIDKMTKDKRDEFPKVDNPLEDLLSDSEEEDTNESEPETSDLPF